MVSTKAPHKEKSQRSITKKYFHVIFPNGLFILAATNPRGRKSQDKGQRKSLVVSKIWVRFFRAAKVAIIHLRGLIGYISNSTPGRLIYIK